MGQNQTRYWVFGFASGVATAAIGSHLLKKVRRPRAHAEYDEDVTVIPLE